MIDNIDLKILELTDNKIISGEELSFIFNISRTAIWKRIKKLEKAGYLFEHKKEGYKLIKRTDYLLENEIKPFLNTVLLGNRYIFFEEIDSTNSFAKTSNLPEGSVVVAETQTSGKGRKGRKWISTKGKGIYFSIVLKPKINIKDILKFSLIFPLSVFHTIKQEGLNPEIKWPNDVYLNNKKVSGILLESDIEGTEIKKVVIGIGINVNQTEKELKDIKSIATSLFLEKHEEINRKKFLANLLINIEKNYFKFLSRDLNPVKEIERNLLWKGKKVRLIDESKEIEGILKGLNEFGGINVSINDKIYEIYTGDLSIRHI